MDMKPTVLPKPEVHPPPPPKLLAGEDVVVEGIPVVQASQTDEYSHFSSGLCDCFSDMRSCCLVFWCPCVAFGRIAEIVDKGASSCCFWGSCYMMFYSLGIATSVGSALGAPIGVASLQWILSCVYRGKLKQSLNMRPSSWGDCCTHFWCETCALCQEYRELQNRGYDLSLGWEGNMNRQVMPPVVFAPEAPSMNR